MICATVEASRARRVCAGIAYIVSLAFDPSPKGGSSGDVRPVRRRLARIDGRSQAARRVKTLIAGFRKAIGAPASEPFVAVKIAELAETQTIVEAMRASALRGEHVDFVALNRLQNTASRLRKHLGLSGLDQPQTDDAPGISEEMVGTIAALFKAPRRRRAR
jgi:hypothetical protein